MIIFLLFFLMEIFDLLDIFCLIGELNFFGCRFCLIILDCNDFGDVIFLILEFVISLFFFNSDDFLLFFVIFFVDKNIDEVFVNLNKE